MSFKSTDREPVNGNDENDDQLAEHNIVRVTWANQVNITVRFIALLVLIAFICWLLWGQR